MVSFWFPPEGPQTPGTSTAQFPPCPLRVRPGQVECNVVSLRIAKVHGEVKFSTFKARRGAPARRADRRLARGARSACFGWDRFRGRNTKDAQRAGLGIYTCVDFEPSAKRTCFLFVFPGAFKKNAEQRVRILQEVHGHQVESLAVSSRKSGLADIAAQDLQEPWCPFRTHTERCKEQWFEP